MSASKENPFNFGARPLDPAPVQTPAASLLGFNTKPREVPVGVEGQMAGKTFLSGVSGAVSGFGAPPASTAAPAPDFTKSAGPVDVKDSSAATSAYFDRMLERGRKRKNVRFATGDLPNLHLGLGDIVKKVRFVGTDGVELPEPRDSTRARTLLAASGVSTTSALRDLNKFNSQAGTAIPPRQTADADIVNFVSNLRSESTLSMINEGLEQSKRDFDNFLENTVQMNWDAQRRKIYEHFGLSRPAGEGDGTSGQPQEESGAFGRSTRRSKFGRLSLGMSFGANGMQRSVLGNSAARASFRGSVSEGTDKGASAGAAIDSEGLDRVRQEAYAERIQELNAARHQEQCYPLLHKLAEVEDQRGNDNKSMLIRTYNALIEIVGERDHILSRSGRNAVLERQFAEAYLDDSPTSQRSIDMRKRIIRGSRACLEKIFMEKIDATVAKDTRIANLGGVPLPINKVRAYIRVLSYRKELGTQIEELQQITVGENTDYCWALIYFLLRCGLVDEASQYALENQRQIRTSDRNFARYLERYAADEDRRLPFEMRNAIQNDYHARTKIAPENQVDPYKIACYKIVGRCDMMDRSLRDVRTDENDWIWLHFALAREVSRFEESASEVLGLADIRTIIDQVEKRHFESNNDQPGGYVTLFFMQVLSGMFEKAVSWLYRHDHIAAVHFAIALSYYGLLRVPDASATELLTFSTRQQARLNFAFVVGYYTAEFRAANPETAVDYLVLISLNSDHQGEAGAHQAKFCFDALRELVLETREFALLLGDIRYDGQRVPGAIQQRVRLIKGSPSQGSNAEDFINNLIVQAAVTADENGRTTDAVLLYHLAGEFETVLAIINRTVSEALIVPLGEDALRLEPLKPRSIPNTSNNGNGNGNDNVTSPAVDTASLSLTSVDDPEVLAAKMLELYKRDSRIYARISDLTRESTEVLLRMASAKRHLLRGQCLQAIHDLVAVQILPLEAAGDIAVVRGYAAKFAELPPVVAHVVGDLLVWGVTACKGEIERLAREGWEDPVRREQRNQLSLAVRDLGVFAGLVRYKLRQGVFEVLAKAGEGA